MVQDFLKFNPQAKQLVCQGEWTLANLAVIKKQLKKITLPDAMVINGSTITKLDSAGAWLLSQFIKKLADNNKNVTLEGFSEPQQKLLSFVKNEKQSLTDIPKTASLGAIARLGKFSLEQLKEFQEYLNFVGQMSYEALRLISNPSLWRWNAVTSVINITGTQALPIIALLSFMIGVVISYQMGNQLRSYGANVFIVDLLGLSVLREFGPLITAIMVSGRTGSAFTAQLGIMKLNQEIDALITMGITPGEILLLPRLIGLFVVLPLLTIWADIFGVMGGMVMANNMLGIGPVDFLQRFEREIPVRALIIGIAKAPVFALIIASIGCFQGMEVGGSAESVGSRTTRSVVLAIFFIIITDAIFSVLLSAYKL